MKRKKVIGICFGVIVFVYASIGAVFFLSAKEKELFTKQEENVKEQEVPMRMSEQEEKVNRDIKDVYSRLENGTLKKEELLADILERKNYLQDNITNVKMEEERFQTLVYHSSYLTSLGETCKNEIVETARDIHSYLIDRLRSEPNEEAEYQFVQRLKNIHEESADELADCIMKKEK